MATSILINDNADIPHLNARLENLRLLNDSQAEHLPEYMHPLYISIIFGGRVSIFIFTFYYTG
jgi:hypothetical protein